MRCLPFRGVPDAELDGFVRDGKVVRFKLKKIKTVLYRDSPLAMFHVWFNNKGYTLHFHFKNYDKYWPGDVSRVNNDDVVQVGTKSKEENQRIDRTNGLEIFNGLLAQGSKLAGNDWMNKNSWKMTGIFLPNLNNGLRSRSFYLKQVVED